jgi:hypothetical protein
MGLMTLHWQGPIAYGGRAKTLFPTENLVKGADSPASMTFLILDIITRQTLGLLWCEVTIFRCFSATHCRQAADYVSVFANNRASP